MATGEPPVDDRFFAVARLAYYTPIREYPPLGDRKAAATLAACGLLITVLLFFAPTLIALVESSRALLAGTVAVLVAAIAVMLVGAAGNAFHALFLPAPPPPQGLAFYPQIAARPREEYREAVKKVTHAQALDDILHYNYSLATQSAIKFGLVERSVRCLEIAFFLWLALAAVIALGGSTDR